MSKKTIKRGNTVPEDNPETQTPADARLEKETNEWLGKLPTFEEIWATHVILNPKKKGPKK